jgi:hypothetical protein
MSNQEPQNQDKINEDAGVQKRRRFIKGASVAAPVVLTLANRPVFGAAQCFSQQMSGNMSHIGEGSCELGKNPAAWRGYLNGQPIPTIGNSITNIALKDQSTVVVRDEEMINKQVTASYVGNTYPPGTKVKIVQNIKVIKQTYYWYGTSFTYGDLFTTQITTRISKGTNFSINVSEEITVEQLTSATPNIDNYNPPQVVVGAKFKAGTQWAYTNADGTKSPNDTTPLNIWPNGYYFAQPLPAKCSDFAKETGTTMRAAFGDSSALDAPMRGILCANADSHESYFVTAMLNASYQPLFGYVMTVDQVKDLFANPSAYPPGYNSVWDFLASTWV